MSNQGHEHSRHFHQEDHRFAYRREINPPIHLQDRKKIIFPESGIFQFTLELLPPEWAVIADDENRFLPICQWGTCFDSKSGIFIKNATIFVQGNLLNLVGLTSKGAADILKDHLEHSHTDLPIVVEPFEPYGRILERPKKPAWEKPLE